MASCVDVCHAQSETTKDAVGPSDAKDGPMQVLQKTGDRSFDHRAYGVLHWLLEGSSRAWRGSLGPRRAYRHHEGRGGLRGVDRRDLFALEDCFARDSLAR